MKATLKITALLIAVTITAAALGWVYAINALKNWADQYVAVSLLQVKEIAPSARFAPKGKAIATATAKLVIKESHPDYAAMTIRELKALCKGTGIKNWARLSKSALIAVLVAQTN